VLTLFLVARYTQILCYLSCWFPELDCFLNLNWKLILPNAIWGKLGDQFTFWSLSFSSYHLALSLSYFSISLLLIFSICMHLPFILITSSFLFDSCSFNAFIFVFVFLDDLHLLLTPRPNSRFSVYNINRTSSYSITFDICGKSHKNKL
jgi:hypothetical protein